MRMRLKPVRGEKVLCLSLGQNVVLLDVIGKDSVRCIMPLGNLSSILKADLNLPIIDTQFYEKIPDDKTQIP